MIWDWISIGAVIVSFLMFIVPIICMEVKKRKEDK